MKKEKIYYFIGGTVAILLLLNFDRVKNILTQGLLSSSEHKKLQAKIYSLIQSYGTPKGAQTGFGRGIDLFKMTEDYSPEGVKKFIYSVAKYNTPNGDTTGYNQFDYSPYDNWLQTGVYQQYLQSKKSGGLKDITSYIIKAAPLLITLI